MPPPRLRLSQQHLAFPKVLRYSGKDCFFDSVVTFMVSVDLALESALK